MAHRKFLLILIAVMLLSLVFTALNSQSIQLELAFIKINVRLGIALVSALALGLVLGMFIRGLWVAQLLSERGRLRRALKAAETKVRALSETQP